MMERCRIAVHQTTYGPLCFGMLESKHRKKTVNGLSYGDTELF